jgi:hypothetical protein
VIVVLLLLAGAMAACFDKPPRPAATGDGAACVSRDPRDDFMMTMTCGTWGTPAGNVVEGGGNLTITPMATDTNGAGCTSNTAVDFTLPVFVAVPTIPGGIGSLVTLSAQASDSSHVSPLLQTYREIGGTNLELVDTYNSSALTTTPYDPASMRWWRLRPAPEGVYGEYSADGMTWLLIARLPGQPPPTAVISLTSSLFQATSPGGDAVFQSFDICP